MGMVPVPVISALTINRAEEPALEPTVPVCHIQLEFKDGGEQAKDGYSPHEEDAGLGEVEREAETESSPDDSDGTQNVNVFA